MGTAALARTQWRTPCTSRILARALCRQGWARTLKDRLAAFRHPGARNRTSGTRGCDIHRTGTGLGDDKPTRRRCRARGRRRLGGGRRRMRCGARRSSHLRRSGSLYGRRGRLDHRFDDGGRNLGHGCHLRFRCRFLKLRFSGPWRFFHHRSWSNACGRRRCNGRLCRDDDDSRRRTRDGLWRDQSRCRLGGLNRSRGCSTGRDSRRLGSNARRTQRHRRCRRNRLPGRS